MKLDSAIKEIDKDIISQEKIIQQLKLKKENFIKIKEDYPNAFIDRGSICLDDIWNKITCMRIERPNSYYGRTSDISVKFLVGKKASICGMKIHTNPLYNSIATIRYNFGSPRRTEITILDYKSIIPDSCPKKNKFIKRIKLYLLNKIINNKLFITDSSYEKEEFTKLMLLR